jgi:hypothetical protein
MGYSREDFLRDSKTQHAVLRRCIPYGNPATMGTVTATFPDDPAWGAGIVTRDSIKVEDSIKLE